MSIRIQVRPNDSAAVDEVGGGYPLPNGIDFFSHTTEIVNGVLRIPFPADVPNANTKFLGVTEGTVSVYFSKGANGSVESLTDIVDSEEGLYLWSASFEDGVLVFDTGEGAPSGPVSVSFYYYPSIH